MAQGVTGSEGSLRQEWMSGGKRSVSPTLASRRRSVSRRVSPSSLALVRLPASSAPEHMSPASLLRLFIAALAGRASRDRK